MEDLVERTKRGETRTFYRVPSQGRTVNSRRIALAVDDEKWQKFRYSLKGLTTESKLIKLQEYFEGNDSLECSGIDCDVCIRVDNYIKALCRGGQLNAGESLNTAINANWKLSIRRN